MFILTIVLEIPYTLILTKCVSLFIFSPKCNYKLNSICFIPKLSFIPWYRADNLQMLGSRKTIRILWHRTGNLQMERPRETIRYPTEWIVMDETACRGQAPLHCCCLTLYRTLQLKVRKSENVGTHELIKTITLERNSVFN